MHEHLAKRVLPVALRSRYNGFQFNLLLIIHRCARTIYFYALLDKAFSCSCLPLKPLSIPLRFHSRVKLTYPC